MTDSRWDIATEDYEFIKWSRTKAFICKVYLLLALSIAAAAAACVFGMSQKIGFELYWPIVLAEFAALFFTIWVRKIRILNLTALFIFTGLTGLSLSPLMGILMAKGLGGHVTLALVLALAVFISLSAYVLLTKRDFSFMGGMLFTSLFTLIVASLFNLFFIPAGMTLPGALLACAGVVIFSGYVLHDTSNLIYAHNHDEYVEATINLYLDFLNLFIDFLRILLEWGRDIDLSGFDIFDLLDF